MPPTQKQPTTLINIQQSRFSLVFVSAVLPSVSALMLLQKKMLIPEKFRYAILGRRTTCAPTQSCSDPKKRLGRRISVSVR